MGAALDQILALYRDGGFVMPWLFLAAVVLWYAIGERWATLRRGDPRRVRELVAAAAQGELGAPRGILDTAAVRAVEETRAPRLTLPTIAAARASLRVGLGDIAGELRRGASLIRAIVIAAPLTGLLGTVAGMIEVFSSLGDMALFSQSGGIAGGIAQALITTQMGLAVAIPGTIALRLLDGREHALRDELEELTEVVAEGWVRP